MIGGLIMVLAGTITMTRPAPAPRAQTPPFARSGTHRLTKRRRSGRNSTRGLQHTDIRFDWPTPTRSPVSSET